MTNETTTPAFYAGKERSRLLANVIFRMGGAAVLLSNKRSYGDRIKYKLVHATRSHGGANDAGYRYVPGILAKSGVWHAFRENSACFADFLGMKL